MALANAMPGYNLQALTIEYTSGQIACQSCRPRASQMSCTVIDPLAKLIIAANAQDACFKHTFRGAVADSKPI